MALCPTQIHAQQDLSEICSIHAASTASDSDDCVALVIFAIKKSADLKGGHIILQGGKVRFGLGENIFRVRGIALSSLTGHVDNRLEVVNALFHRQNTIELALAVRQLRSHFLRMRGVIPQVRSSCLLRQLRDLSAKTLGLYNGGNIFHRRTQGLDLFRKLNGHV